MSRTHSSIQVNKELFKEGKVGKRVLLQSALSFNVLYMLQTNKTQLKALNEPTMVDSTCQYSQNEPARPVHLYFALRVKAKTSFPVLLQMSCRSFYSDYFIKRLHSVARHFSAVFPKFTLGFPQVKRGVTIIEPCVGGASEFSPPLCVNEHLLWDLALVQTSKDVSLIVGKGLMLYIAYKSAFPVMACECCHISIFTQPRRCTDSFVHYTLFLPQ